VTDVEITIEHFLDAVGQLPSNDDLERCNCTLTGRGHEQCGWNTEEDMPVFMVGKSEVQGVTAKMRFSGNQIASALMDAICAKSIDGLGGGPSWMKWKDENQSRPNFDLALAYAQDEIDSVTAIYVAMRRAFLEDREREARRRARRKEREALVES